MSVNDKNPRYYTLFFDSPCEVTIGQPHDKKTLSVCRTNTLEIVQFNPQSGNYDTLTVGLQIAPRHNAMGLTINTHQKGFQIREERRVPEPFTELWYDLSSGRKTENPLDGTKAL